MKNRQPPVLGHNDNAFIGVMNAVRRGGLYAGKVEAAKQVNWFPTIEHVNAQPVLRIVSSEFELHFDAQGNPSLVDEGILSSSIIS